MTHVLMCGPFAKTGGVATHTINLIKLLEGKNIIVSSYNLSGFSVESGEQNILIKLYQRTLGLLICIVRKYKAINIIHVQASGGIFAFIPALIGALTSHFFDIFCIVTFHHSQTAAFVKKYQGIFGITLKYCDKLILVSPRQERIIIDTFPQFREKVTVIGNGYNPSTYFPLDKDRCRIELGIPLDKFVIFNISNLIPTKGQKYLIQACRQLQKERDDLLCYIAGRGQMKEELHQEIIENNCEDTIKLIGYLKEEDIKKWMSASDLFVFPSLAESFGIVVIEAFACGLPVISTINGGSESIITNNALGFLCPTKDPICLKEKIAISIVKKWDRDYIQEFAKNYTWENVANRTKNLYISIISKTQ